MTLNNTIITIIITTGINLGGR